VEAVRGYFPTPASAIFGKIRVMLSVPPSARWIIMIEMSWLFGSIPALRVERCAEVVHSPSHGPGNLIVTEYMGMK
jgi:hypothetical protein